MDCLLELLKSMGDQKRQHNKFLQKAVEIRSQLTEDFSVSTAETVRAQMNELQTAERLADSKKEYAQELEDEAKSRLNVASKQADVLRRLAKLGDVAGTEIDAIEEKALKRAERAAELISIIEDQSQKHANHAKQLGDDLPGLVLQRMVEAEQSVLERGGYNERLSVIAEAFFKRTKRKTEKGKKEQKRQVMLFIELLGDPLARDLTTAMLDDAVEKSAQLPKEQGIAVGKTGAEMLELGLPARALQTTNNHFNSVRTFFRWAANRNRIERNYAGVIEDFEINSAQETSNRRSWNLEELQQLFDSYVYRFDGTAIGKKHGNEDLHEGSFWIPLIALFSGARAEEICSLKPEHIVEIDNVWCFDMVEFDEDGKPIKKNKSSVRVFPIHKRLIDFGLVEYAQMRCEARRKMLFDLKLSEGKWSHAFSKWFNRTFKVRAGIVPGENVDKNEVVFHSFRNNIVEEFEVRKIPESSYSWVTGHSTGGVARRTYPFKGKKIFPPRELIDVVNAVTHEGLDLSHVSFDGFKKKYMKKRRKARVRC
ncbi:hypothetical protein [Neptuniibacter sp.]|uniref:hypothetical protein n=1 Tax=Neptuniibacter sp. TaxID=1962643 RepID=UPI00260E282D|nr:hypothetical protein [Neptuniibacter sp.]MCP4597194.1 hypothetical protein [Neptuniibacter sp.]